jgi:hypothetical protein
MEFIDDYNDDAIAPGPRGALDAPGPGGVLNTPGSVGLVNTDYLDII